MTIKKTKTTKVWLHGISGRMGAEISKLLAESTTLRLCAGSDHLTSQTMWKNLDQADVIIDFSSPTGNNLLLSKITRLKGKRILIGTTGLVASMLKKWDAIAKKQGHTVLLAPNTSLGVYILAQNIGRFALALSAADWDIEIIESHHNKKIDAPSGTALFLARMIQLACPQHKIVTSRAGSRTKRTIGIHAVRGGGIFGEHEIRFIGSHEEIYIGHRAFSRALFSEGAVRLAEKLVETKIKGVITIEDFK